MTTITINGKTVFDGEASGGVSIINGKLFIDDTEVSTDQQLNSVKVEIHGNTGPVSVKQGSVTVNGDVYGYVDSGGSASCNDIAGNVDCGGSVNARDVQGSIDCGGSVNCGKVGGRIDAGGSVRYTK